VDISIGCHFVFAVPTDTHAVVLVEPHVDELARVIAPQFTAEPAVAMSSYLDRFANHCRRMTFPQGEVRLSYAATVKDDGCVDVIDERAPELAPGDLPDEALQYLLPSRYCQSDEIAPFAYEQFGAVDSGWTRVQAISNWVHERIGFDYGAASPMTTAVDVLRDGHGVCRDFTHLGIALCRAIEIPARMVVGYLHELVPMDQHAWWEAYVGGRWFTFDATQSQPRGNRVAVAYGRDAADVAFVTQFGPLELTDMSVYVTPADPRTVI
jgi:transglutaminase-like putative cysteine protease